MYTVFRVEHFCVMFHVEHNQRPILLNYPVDFLENFFAYRSCSDCSWRRLGHAG